MAQGVSPFVEIPFWVPTALAGVWQVDCRKASAAGLVFRPLEETLCDTLAWFAGRDDQALRAGLSAERERALLTTWQQQ